MKWLLGLVILVVFGLAGVFYSRESDLFSNEGVTNTNTKEEKIMPEKEEMRLSSPAFGPGGLIPGRYTCDGENKNPTLIISGVPETAKSLVLIMDDPDVPKNIRQDGLWVHWVRFNIPPATKEITENVEPEGIPGHGTGGNAKYLGPCPPDREHRYFFKLYALDTVLSLKEGSSKSEVEEAMSRHVISSAELIGRYNRRR